MKELTQILAHIDSSLTEAVGNRKHSWHTLVLADKSAQARMLVIRGCGGNNIFFHTHAKSQKVINFQKDDRASVLAYAPDLKQQVRFTGKVSLLHNDPGSEDKWQKLSISARRCYLTDQPGTILSEAGSGYHKKFDYADQLLLHESDYAAENFLRIKFCYHKIDFLHLAAHGHIRAKFLFLEDGWQGSWVAP